MHLGLRLVLVSAAFGCAHVSPQPPFGAGLEPLTFEERVLASAIEATKTMPGPLHLPAPFCVSFHDTLHDDPVPGPELSRLPVSAHLVPWEQCPPTYASMVRVVDSLGHSLQPERPQGYIDPYRLRIWRPVRVTAQMLAVRIDASQGTHGWLLYCEVLRAEPRRADCGVLRTWVN